MVFGGCPQPLGCTLLLRGGDGEQLRRVKRVASFAAYAAYWGVLEGTLLSDQLAAAAAAMLGGDEAAQEVAGAADAVASTSYLATAEGRGRQAILSASPHVSVVLERGAPAAQDLLLPDPQAAASATRQDESECADAAAAEAGAAALGVGTAATATAVEAGRERGGSGSNSTAGELCLLCSPPSAAGRSSATVAEASPPPSPGSPTDPLHRAAREFALQQLQLTGSEPSSPADAGVLAASAAAAASPGGSELPAEVPSPCGSAAAAAAVVATAAAAAVAAAATPSISPTSSPGTAAYRGQRLWLAISCRNPGKGVLCEPSHPHCMDFYTDTGGGAVGCSGVVSCVCAWGCG